MADIKLDFIWSTTNAGELQVEVVPEGLEGPVLGSFEFDNETIIEALKGDIKKGSYEDLEEWVELADNLSDLSTCIRHQVQKEIEC